MIGPILLALISLGMLLLATRLMRSGLRQARTDRVMERLGQGQPQALNDKTVVSSLERMFIRAGLGKPTERLGLWLTLWGLGVVLGVLAAQWLGLLAMLLLPPLILRFYLALRYQRRLRRMIEQLPQLLDHAVRSLKSGRTLADAVLGGIEASDDPLKRSMGRIKRNVILGVSLPEAVHDFAEFYEQDELRLFALGLKVNHRYGGNASELLENLIKLIRERDQGARQLRAMTGETRVTAVVLALLPVSVAGYFLLTNPTYLVGMWTDDSGRWMLVGAFLMQVFGCVALWRMLRSV
ncbi:type II secretion system F family protein [Pseudomonas sp. NIBRBAC000502773]|jgi:tight adherence protein B|uniref:type II secretion system F family protein n=1 Tax=Pseudomonas TaxID=286 RepID=UPI0011318656|nr:type II secretion system F family protein [Pseudomonas sp. NIBRBAC000502773]QDG58470.1 type II secretion system protein F [Pseudomonas sp. NIBRBAC000502773]